MEYEEKKFKIYMRRSQKNLWNFVDSFLETYLGPSWTSMIVGFFAKTVFPNFETFKVEKKSFYPWVGYELADK